MEKSFVLNGNKLIAEFLGFKKCNSLSYYLLDGFELILEQKTTIESNWCEILIEQDECKPEIMKFSTSWDWLMPVVEKIENLNYEVIILSHNNWIQPKRCKISTYQNDEIITIYGNDKLTVIYKAVVEFIKRYNKNKK